MLFKNDVTSLYESNATDPTFIDLSVKRIDLIKRHDELRARKNPSSIPKSQFTTASMPLALRAQSPADPGVTLDRR